MNIWLVMIIILTSFFICAVAVDIRSVYRMRASGEKFIKVKKRRQKYFSVMWPGLCLLNILINFISAVDYIGDGHAEYHIREISNNAGLCLFFLLALILHIMSLCERVYISEKYIVSGGYFYPTDKVKFSLDSPAAGFGNDKNINLFYQNSKTPFCLIPYNEKTPDEEYYKILETFTGRDHSDHKRRSFSNPLVISWIITSCVLIAGGFFVYRNISLPWISIGKCMILKNQEVVSFSPVPFDENNEYYFKPGKSVDGELYKLKELTDLKSLNITQCSVSDLSFLGDLDSLEELYMGGGSRTEMPDDNSPLDHLTGLKVFEYYGSEKFDRYESLLKMPELYKLTLTRRHISSADIGQIKKIPALRKLDLELCVIEDDSGIEALDGITSLNISGAAFENIAVLAKMDSIEELTLYNLETDDFSFLSEMDSLRTLHIGHDKLPENLVRDLEKNGVTVK